MRAWACDAQLDHLMIAVRRAFASGALPSRQTVLSDILILSTLVFSRNIVLSCLLLYISIFFCSARRVAFCDFDVLQMLF